MVLPVRQFFLAPVTNEKWWMFRERPCAANFASRNKSQFIDMNPLMPAFGGTTGGLDGMQFSRNILAAPADSSPFCRVQRLAGHARVQDRVLPRAL